LHDVAKNKQFKSSAEERKLFIHLHRIIDCLNLEEVFLFEKNGLIFNFHNYYEEPQRVELDKLKKDVIKKIGYI